jgi:hypothetical protein
MRLLIFTDSRRAISKIEYASAEDVLRAINSLSKNTRLELLQTDAHLSIVCVDDERVWATFKGHRNIADKRFATLVDQKYSGDDGQIEVLIDGEETLIPLTATAAKEIAAQVAVHYLEFGEIPTDVTWTGRIV